MHRPVSLAIALLALGAASPALSQSWPAGVVAAAPRALPGPTQPFVVVRDEDTAIRRRPTVPPTDPRTGRQAALAQHDAEPILEVDIRPKPEWSDDQGLRVASGRVAFKRRF